MSTSSVRDFRFVKFDGVEVTPRDVALQLFYETCATTEEIEAASKLLAEDLIEALNDGTSFQDFRYDLMTEAKVAYNNLWKELDGTGSYELARSHWMTTMFRVGVVNLLEVWSFRVFPRDMNESTKTEWDPSQLPAG